MRALRLRKEAPDEIEDALKLHRGQSPLAALRFLVAVDETLARIREEPETFSTRHRHTRDRARPSAPARLAAPRTLTPGWHRPDLRSRPAGRISSHKAVASIPGPRYNEAIQLLVRRQDPPPTRGKPPWDRPDCSMFVQSPVL
jgi:hypothetical protein